MSQEISLTWLQAKVIVICFKDQRGLERVTGAKVYSCWQLWTSIFLNRREVYRVF